jgi:hypothetical protein
LIEEDKTVQIPALPRETSSTWLGVGAGSAGLIWAVTLVSMFANEPTTGMLIAAGLCASMTVSVGTIVAWTRHSLTRTAARQQNEMQLVAAGQYTLAMAEIRSVRKAVELTAGYATSERRALSAKVSELETQVATYWHGAADMLEQMTGTEDNVRHVAFGRAPVRPVDS